MTEKSGFGITGSSAILGVGVFAIGAAIVGVVVNMLGEPEPAVVEASAPAVDAAPEPQPQPATEEATAESAPDTPAEDVSEVPTEELPAQESADATPDETEAPVATPEAPPLEGPKFDVVRIDPFGAAVIAGTAAPGARVMLSTDGTQVAEAVADRNGKYVALFDLAPSTDPRSLSAEMITVEGETVASSGTVLIAPTKPVEVADAEPAAEGDEAGAGEPAAAEPVDTVAAVEPEPAEVAESVDEGVPTGEGSPSQEDTPAEDSVVDAEPAPEPEAEPARPAIVLADESGVKVLQPAPQPAAPADEAVSDVAPEVVANLVIDTITYDTTGDVALSGRGDGASFARVYLNDKPVQTVKIEDDGTWRTPLPDVDAGVYRLRVDEVTSEGAVTSRVETPFQREEPELVAEAATQPNAVTVQEGFTLWAIARERFGDGTQYVRVYEANRSLIRDPDLIYPGQIFELPEG